MVFKPEVPDFQRTSERYFKQLRELKEVLGPAIEAAREREKLREEYKDASDKSIFLFFEPAVIHTDKALLQAAEILGIEQEAQP